MLRVCLDDTETLELLVSAAEDFARAEIPQEVAKSFMLASMTAVQKKDGGVRGIATGTSFRRLVAKKTLARQFGPVVEATCSPFQFALSTRAGRIVRGTRSDLRQRECSPLMVWEHTTTCIEVQ